MTKKIIGIFLCFIASMCAQQDKSASNILSIAMPVEMVSIDPYKVMDIPSGRIKQQVFEQLFRYDSNGNVQNCLAESWTNISDTILQVSIKSNVMFHNGELLTAEDVKYSFEKAKASAAASSSVEEIKQVKVVDDYTVQIILKQTYAPIFAALSTTSTYIVNKKSYEEGEVCIGTGPFKLAEWNRGQNVRLERFDDYWGTPAGMEQIDVRTVPEQLIRTISLENGEIDLSYEVSFSEKERIKENPNFVFHDSPINRIEYLAFNETRAPYNNVALRNAIAYTIDVPGIISSVLFGGGVRADANAPNTLRKGMPRNYNNRDLEKAKECLEKSGIPQGTTLTLTVNTGVRKNIAEVIQANLKDIGLNLEIDVFEWSKYVDLTYNLELNMFIGGWSIAPDLDLYYSAFYYSQNIGPGGNFTEYNNSEVDALLEEARSTIDPKKRTALYIKIEEKVRERIPMIPLYYPVNALAYQKNIKNVRYDAFEERYWAPITKE